MLVLSVAVNAVIYARDPLISQSFYEQVNRLRRDQT